MNNPENNFNDRVQWNRFRTIWTQSTWSELGTLSYLACLTGLTQFIIFFWLMFDWPGMTKYFVMSDCDRFRYISENIEYNKGKASIMVMTMLPSWVILGILNSYETPPKQGETSRWLSRPISNYFAVLSYTGCVSVVLFNQQMSVNTAEQDRQHDMHIFGALVLSLSYVAMHFLTCNKFIPELERLGRRYLSAELCSDLDSYFTFAYAYAIVDILFFGFYILLYEANACNTIVIYFEYFLYIGTALFNIVLYFQFTVVHVLAKIDFVNVFTQIDNHEVLVAT